jgi:hypothetical protein
MSTTAGVFTETTLNAIRVKMAEAMLDSRVKLQYQPKADALKTLAQATTARFAPLNAREKDYDVELEWINVCRDGVVAFASCEFGGAKASTNIKKYSLTYDKAFKFSIDESDFMTNDFDFAEVMAKQILKGDVELMEAFAGYFITFLNANKGNDLFTTGAYYCATGDAHVPAINWTANLIAYFLMMSKMNQFANPILLDGGLMYQQYLLANFNAGNDNGKGAAALYQGMPLNFDLFNPAVINGDILTDYLIETGSVSWANKVYHNAGAPTINQDGLIKFSQPSKFGDILPLQYDIAMQPACTTNNLTKYDVTMRLKADIFANPTGCDANNTGILTVECGNCP